MKIAVPVFALMLLCGCAHRPARPGVNYFVGPECHATAQLRGCDTSSPPRCKAVALSYTKDCEQIAVH